MCYAVYFTAKKLKQYFQEHVVTVVSTVPIGKIMGCRDASGRVAKWATELAGHTILYDPRTTIKSQALADFRVDWTETQYLLPPPDTAHWRMHFDGSKMHSGLGAVIVLSSPKGNRHRYTLQIHFAASKNVADYAPASENGATDALAKINSSRQGIPSGVSLEHLHKTSDKTSPDSESIFVPDDQAACLPGPGTSEPSPGTTMTNPANANSDLIPGAAELGQGATLLNPAAVIPNPGAATSGPGAAAPEPAIVAVFTDKGIEILLDIHQGECGHHAASRSLVAKDFRHGLYWPTALQDVESLVLKCEGCQRFSKRSHQPASALRTIQITWPFAVWGLDMVGPFKTAQGGMTHLLLAVDKFTKWIEARPIKKLDGPIAVRFIKNVAGHYGVLNSIIMDNGTNFAKGVLTQYCSVSGIRLDLASMAHPQSNGHVERSAIYQQGLRHYHSKKIKPLAFCEGDLVLRLIQQQAGQHKLAAPWEGTFIVSKAL
ncbi:uncharacterized protein [Aegilops tauschii subsp. strangulata]|uniref:uncharacterized protein n=1 Tax=Aegilops tauschii subsp. strangulata TaxID=200361 RepID=UPI003CC85791